MPGMNNREGIKVPGEFIPGTPQGYVVDSQYVRGTYIVVQLFKEIDYIPERAKVNGTIIYVVETDEEYRIVKGDLVKLPRRIKMSPIDGNIYAFKDGHWIVLDSSVFVTPKDLKEAMKSLYDDIENQINTSADDILEKSKEYTDERLKDYSIIDYKIVDELPETGEKGILYLVKCEHGDKDSYDEYIWSEEGWEKLGNTDIDLSNYYTKEEADKLLDELKSDIETQLEEKAGTTYVDEQIDNLSHTVEDTYATKVNLQNAASSLNTSIVKNGSDISALLQTTANQSEQINTISSKLGTFATTEYVDEEVKKVSNTTYTLSQNNEEKTILLKGSDGNTSSVVLSSILGTMAFEGKDNYMTKEEAEAFETEMDSKIESISTTISEEVVKYGDDILLQCGNSTI